MTGVLEQTRVLTLLDQMLALQRELQSLDLSYCAEDDAVAAVRRYEELRRGAETIDHALLMSVEQLGIPARSGSRSTANWLRNTVRVDIHEANARVAAARVAGPRRSLLGEPLAPVYPVVAAGQAAGVVGVKQARAITRMLGKLPAAVCEEIPAVEARLVGFCTTLDANQVAQCAARERAHLDPDGGYRDVERRRRERDFRFTQRPDGSCRGSFEGTAEFAEFLQVAFDALAAPEPESHGIKDPRTAGQRRHDALLDALKVAIAAGSLPTAGGVMTTVVLTMTEHAYRSGVGFATTGHGALVPVREAMCWAGGDYRLFLTVLNSVREIVAYSTCHRLFTENERLAMIARDGGCAFPGCSAPPGWTQAHHVTEWRDSHRTSVDDGCLLCAYHHREFERLGWTVRIVEGRPTWTPPRLIDPDQKPIRV